MKNRLFCWVCFLGMCYIMLDVTSCLRLDSDSRGRAGGLYEWWVHQGRMWKGMFWFWGHPGPAKVRTGNLNCWWELHENNRINPKANEIVFSFRKYSQFRRERASDRIYWIGLRLGTAPQAGAIDYETTYTLLRNQPGPRPFYVHYSPTFPSRYN